MRLLLAAACLAAFSCLPAQGGDQSNNAANSSGVDDKGNRGAGNHDETTPKPPQHGTGIVKTPGEQAMQRIRATNEAVGTPGPPVQTSVGTEDVRAGLNAGLFMGSLATFLPRSQVVPSAHEMDHAEPRLSLATLLNLPQDNTGAFVGNIWGAAPQSQPDQPQGPGFWTGLGSEAGHPPADTSAYWAEAIHPLVPEYPAQLGGPMGRYDYNHGDYETARKELDLAIRAGDRSADNLYLRGASAEKLGDHRSAHEDAAQALKLDTGHGRAESLLKLTDRKLGEVKEPSRLGLGPEAEDEESVRLRSGRGRDGETLPVSNRGRSARLRPLSDEARERMKVGDLARALELLDKAVKLDPKDARALHLRADAELRTKKFEDAEKDSASLLEFVPGHTGGLNMRALARNRLKKYQAALEDADAAVQSNPYSAMAHYNRAYALAGLGRRAEALKELERAAQLDPKYRSLYRRFAGLPADADPTLIFSEEPEAGAPAAGSPGRGRRAIPWWAWALAFVVGGLGALALARLRPAAAGLTPAPVTPLSQLAAGALLGRYRVEREAGSGGMGVVYEAFDESLQRKVALKRMRPEILSNPRERERFLAEARTVAALRHPNIVSIHSVEDDGTDGYLVFEFVEGSTLSQLLRRDGRLPPARARDILGPVCGALEYAHGQGVIHRDLKPSNIMVDSRGVPKVMDFGVARQSADALGRLTVTRTVCGTPEYRAPEEERGRVGRETDVYALGVCLYQLLTGRLPFEGADVAALRRKLAGDFVPASSLVPGISPAVDRLLARALEPDPGRRFHSAKEFAEALASV